MRVAQRTKYPGVMAWRMAVLVLLSTDLEVGGGGSSLAGGIPRVHLGGCRTQGAQKKKDKITQAAVETRLGGSRDVKGLC